MLSLSYSSTISFILALIGLSCAAPAAPSHDGSGGGKPVAHVKNGTYEGLYSPKYNQDFFLGVPYAQPPLKDLRFANPVSLNATWTGSHDASSYSPACVGYGPSQWGYALSEDCLYLNVIRPAGIHKPLPVAVWIHGGGYVQGSGVDFRYNLSFIVNQSVAIGQPIIGVTLNYRLSAWGFLQSEEVKQSGNSNFGLRDQRLALHWLQENVAAFGGDPKQVTIWGQSAGAMSVGSHLLAFNGRDDGLFRAAIMESGGPASLTAATRSFQPSYNNLTQRAGCNEVTDSLQCLRSLSFEKLNAAINTTSLTGIWRPDLDDDFIQQHSLRQFADGTFVHVPILIGTNSDESTTLAAPSNINTTEEFRELLLDDGFSPLNANSILAAYPNDPKFTVLQNLPPDFVPGSPYGAQYRRVVTYQSDQAFIAGRRLTAQTWADAGLPVYSYRFDAIPAWATQIQGSTHFSEVAFVMLNLDGVGYPPVRIPPFQGKPPSFAALAELMSADWIRFVAGLTPNDKSRVSVSPWPPYSPGGDGENFVYTANETSFIEQDSWRQEAIQTLVDIATDLYS